MIARDVVYTEGWLPPWAVSVLTLAAAVALALLVHTFLFRAMSRLVRDQDLFWRSLVARTSGPVRLGVITFALSIASEVAPLSPGERSVLRHILLVGFIGLLGWATLTAPHIWTTIYLRRFKLDSQDNLLARKHVTQTRILRRVAGTLIITITIGAAMMTFSGVQQYGVSLLASAGAAGLVVGLALQPLLKNIFAGIQLAVTQPIRLDDAVIVEGEWGKVEEITSTYVVVHLWDLRGMVLPPIYFLEKPFQNWTRDSSALIGRVMIYLDYFVPVEEMRAKLKEVAKSSPNWDGKVVALQVTDFRDGGPHARQRRQCGPRLRPTLRGARDGDRLAPGGTSLRPAAPQNRDREPAARGLLARRAGA